MSSSEESNHEDSMDEDQEPQELTLPEFRQRYEDLVKEIKDLVMHDDDDENISEHVEILKQNLNTGSSLMKHVGTDNAKLHCTLKHLKACLELAEKKCKSMGTVKPFNIHKYLDILYAKSFDSRGDYNEDKFLRNMTVEMNKYTNTSFSLVSLLGVLDLNAAAPIPPPVKVRNSVRNKHAFDETAATQHQVVNSEVNQTVDKEDSLAATRQMAVKLQKMCASKNTESIGLYDFGLQDGTTDTHKFVQNIFNAACLARDGFARLTVDGKENEANNGPLPYSNWKIKDAQPPKGRGANDTKNVHRNQHIISFNAATFKALLAANGGQNLLTTKKEKVSKRKANEHLPSSSKTAKIIDDDSD